MKFTYEDCKILDELYKTRVDSPLYRSDRWPVEYAEETRKFSGICHTNEHGESFMEEN